MFTKVRYMLHEVFCFVIFCYVGTFLFLLSIYVYLSLILKPRAMVLGRLRLLDTWAITGVRHMFICLGGLSDVPFTVLLQFFVRPSFFLKQKPVLFRTKTRQFTVHSTGQCIYIVFFSVPLHRSAPFRTVQRSPFRPASRMTSRRRDATT